MEAGAATRRKPEDIAADLDTTVFGKMGQDTAPPQMLPLTAIVASRYQSRGRMDEEYMENLVEGIRMDGLHDPIIVRPLPPEQSEGGCYSITPRFELVAGHHRVEAFRRLGRTEIPAFVRALSDAEAARALTTENTNRKNLAHWELYKHMQMLRAAGAIRFNTELARLLNIDRTAIPQLDAFGLLPQSAQDLLDDKPDLFGYNLAHKLKPFLPEHGMLVFDALVLLSKGKLAQAAVPAWIDEKVNPRPKKLRKDFALAGGVRLVVTDDGARVTGNIDYDALHQLVEAHLPQLLKAHQ
jgi:ParB family chromosome partitioning protein